jgi:ankyrin repeat protein
MSEADDRAGRFLRLVGTGDLEGVRTALARAPELVNVIGPHPFWGGRPQPLHVAIETGRREMIDMLLDAGADVSGANGQYDAWSPLMLAIQRRRDGLPDVLRQRGARIGVVEALMLGDDELVGKLLQPGPFVLPSPPPNGGSLLSFARTTFAIDRLIALGVSPDTKDRWGTTPIESLSGLGAEGLPLVRHLVARGIAAPPHVYARLGDRQTLEDIIEAHPEAARDADVMMGAVEFRHLALVEWLLGRGADVNARASARARHTALHSAAWNGDLAMVKLLVVAGADINARDDEHDATPAGWAETAAEITNNPDCHPVVEFLESSSRA